MRGVYLRPLAEDDAEAYFEAVDENRTHLSQFGNTTAKNCRTPEDVRRSIVSPRDPARLRLGIWDKERFVGSTDLHSPPGNRGSVVEIGYWLRASALGNGYAHAAVDALAKRCPRYISLRAWVHKENLPSQRVLESSHFSLRATDVELLEYELLHSTAGKQKEPVLYIQTLEKTPQQSIARVALRGKNKTCYNQECTITYEVIHGEGTMVTGNSEAHLLPGARITIPPGTPYQGRGDVVMIATATPPFRLDEVVVLENDLYCK